MTIYTTGEVDAQALAMLLKERDELRDALKEHASEIERLTSDVIFEQQAGSLSWIAQAELKEELAAQRRELEQALDALQLCAKTVSNEQIYRRDKAITAIQEQLK